MNVEITQPEDKYTLCKGCIYKMLNEHYRKKVLDMKELVENFIYYNWLRDQGRIVANPDKVRHFRVGENYSNQRLIELQDA